MDVNPVRLEAPHVTLSDAELAQIEVELESWCLESSINLDDIEAELQKSLQEDDIDDDGLKQLSGFKLLVKSITGINSTRQDSLALVQEASNALVESNYLLVCQGNRRQAIYPTDTEELLNSISTINSKRQDSPALAQDAINALVESSADSSDAAVCHDNQQQATCLTDTNEMPCAKHDRSELSANPSRIVQVYFDGIDADVITNSKGGPTEWHYVDDEPVAVDARLGVATDNAKERTRVVEEQLILAKLRLGEIQEKFELYRCIRLIQKWFRRKILIRRASMCINIIRILYRGLIRRGFLAFCRWKASIQCLRVCRGFVIRRRLLSAQKQRSSINMCKLISRVLTRRGFRAMRRWKAAVIIQRIYRGFIIRTGLLSVRKQLSSIHICRIVCRVLTHRGFRSFHRWKAAVIVQRVCRGFFIRMRLLSVRKYQSSTYLCQIVCRVLIHSGFHALYRWKALSVRKHQAIIHVCLTLCRTLSRHGFLTLYRWKAAVKIQRIHRGFIIRKRLLAIRNRDFAYVDSELDSLLCADVTDLLLFDDEIEGDSDWSPLMPMSSNINIHRVNSGPKHIRRSSKDASSNQGNQHDTRKAPFSEQSAMEHENNYSGANMHEKKHLSEWRIKDSRVAQASQTSKLS